MNLSIIIGEEKLKLIVAQEISVKLAIPVDPNDIHINRIGAEIKAEFETNIGG